MHASEEPPAIGRPLPRPMLDKIAVEEHFNFLAARTAGPPSVDVESLVRSMDYDTRWLELVTTA